MAQWWREEEGVAAGQEAGARIARLEKLIEVDGPRADWDKKLDSSRKRVADLRSTNFDLWLLQIRALTAAGEMAEVLGKSEEAIALYVRAFTYRSYIYHQDLSGISEEQMADFREWGEWPRAKLGKSGIDADEMLRRAEESKKEAGEEFYATLPYL